MAHEHSPHPSRPSSGASQIPRRVELARYLERVAEVAEARGRPVVLSPACARVVGRAVLVNDAGLAPDERLVLDLLRAAGEPLDEAEVCRLYEWASAVEIDHAALQLVRAGRTKVRWLDGEPEPRFWPKERPAA